MSEHWAPAPPPKTPRRWPKRLGWAGAVFVLLLIILYFVATSHTFLNAVILPKVAAALGTPVTIADSSISPFRKVTLRDVKIGGSAFEEPVIAAREVRVRYSLKDILGGNINVHEISLISPVVQIVQQEDGTSNLDPLLKPSTEPPPPSETPAKPVQFHLGRLLLTNALVRFTRNLPRGTREVAELSNVNISAANLGNAKAGTLNLATAIRFERTPGQNATNITGELIEAKLAGAFDIALTADLKPDTLRGTVGLDVVTPPAAAKDIKGTAATLECDLTPTELRQLALTFKQGERTLGQITASGPLDLQRKEGQIKLQITSIDRHALNIAGAAAGVDFGSTTINSGQQITITNAGQLVIASGRFAVDKLSVVQRGVTTRPLNLALDYSFTLDQERKSALIERLTVSGEQDAVKIISGALEGPMRVDLGGGTNFVDPSAFNLQVTNFNLADWRAFVGDISGVASLGLRVTAANAGKQLAAQLDSRVANLSANLGSDRIQRASAALALRAALDDMNNFRLDDLLLRVDREQQTAVTLTGSAKGALRSRELDGSFALQAYVAQVTNLLTLTGLPPGTLKLETQIQQRGQKLEFNNLVLQLQQAGRAPSIASVRGSYDLAATNGSAVVRVQLPDVFALAPTNPASGKPLSLDLMLDANLANQVANIREFTGKIVQSGKPGGSFGATGQFNLADQSGSLRLKLSDLNEATLAAFLDPALGQSRTLKSSSIDLTADAQYNPKATSVVKCELQVGNLLINDPTKQLPASPLNAVVKLGASMQQDAVVVDELSADIRMANASGGQIRSTGKYHLKTKAAEGTFKVVDLNEKLLAAFAPMVAGGRQLASASINIDLTGRYDPGRDASIRGDVDISNLLLSDQRGNFPKTPLAVGLQVNTAMATNKSLNIETLRLKLAPTARARNEINLAGKLDLSRTNAFSGELQLLADSLDFTSYYDIFAGSKATNAVASPSSGKSSAPTPVASRPAPPTEPAPIKLPFQNFNFAINVGQLYVRDLAIHNWQTAIKLDNSKVQVAPLQLLINGGLCKGAIVLNLGVPGYQYDIALNADKIPIGPAVDTFSPEQKGKIKGDLILVSQIKGAGVTGRSLQSNLAGDVLFSFTNANFQLTSPWVKTLFYPIGLAVGAPDLVNAPVSWVGATAKIGDGKINFTQFNLVSDTFTADTQGPIKIAELIPDSPIEKWPMHLSLKRSLAQRVGKIPRNTPPDAAYVKMPDFVNVVGTVGSPKPEINKLALAGTISERLLDKALGDKAGGLNPLNLLGK